MRYAITGVHRELQPREANLVKLVIASLPDVTELTTGAAFGVDTAAYMVGIEYHKNARHRIVVPQAPHNDKPVCEAISRQHIVEQAPSGFSTLDSYMNRNERLILHADKLIAFPETDSEEMRSGTWATIRRARRAGIGIEIHPLNGHAAEDGSGAHLRGRARRARRASRGRRGPNPGNAAA